MHNIVIRCTKRWNAGEMAIAVYYSTYSAKYAVRRTLEPVRIGEYWQKVGRACLSQLLHFPGTSLHFPGTSLHFPGTSFREDVQVETGSDKVVTGIRHLSMEGISRGYMHFSVSKTVLYFCPIRKT